jgi:raffinose/stachyose/melibiose transport system substrate-binding protein
VEPFDHLAGTGVTVEADRTSGGPACPGQSTTPLLSRRSLLKAAVFGAVAMPLSACGVLGVAAGSGSSDTIRFAETKPEVVPYFDKLVANFNQRQTGVQVIDDSTSSLIAEFVRGNPPDLDCDNYNLTTSIFIARGVLADLAGLPEAELIDPKVQALVSQYGSYKGQTSVLPYSITAAGVIYNKDLFDQHGVQVPMTWSQLIAACETFKSKGVTPFYATYADPWTIQQGLFDYVSGGLLDVADFYTRLKAQGTNIGPHSPVSFGHTFKPAVDKMLQLAAYANADASARSYADGNTAMANGKAAMYLQGPWAIGEIANANPKTRVGTFPLPVTDNPADTKARVNLDLALWIPTSTTKSAAARRFLSYLMQPDVMFTYNNDNLAFSPVKNPPPVKDQRIAGLEPYVRAAQFYQGAGTYMPNVIPIGNYLQAMVLTNNGGGALHSLDNDWRRLAKRSV